MRQANSNNFILITGASGMIGRALVERAFRQNWASLGWKLRLQVRKRQSLAPGLASRLDPKFFEVVEVDFTQMSDAQLDRLLSGVAAVVHTGGCAHRPDAPFTEFELINVRATQAIAEAAARSGCSQFIFFSSSAVYGPGPFADVSEEQTAVPTTPYAVSKLCSEQWLKSCTGIKSKIILRPSLVFGEGDRGNLLSLMKQISKKRYFNVGVHKTAKSLVYAGDVALAVELCLDKVEGDYRIFNVANPHSVDLETLSSGIAIALGQKNNIPTVPTSLAKAGAGALQAMLKEKSPVTVSQIEKLSTTTTVSVKNLIEATGFAPEHSLAEALKAEVEWARKEGQI